MLCQTNQIFLKALLFTAITTKSAWGNEKLYYKNGNINDPHYPFEGGYLCGAFASTKELGACSRKQMDELISNSGYSEETFFDKLLDIEEDLQKKREEINLKFRNNITHLYDRTPNDSSLTYILSLPERAQLAQVLYEKQQNDIQACTNDATSQIYNKLKDVFRDSLKISSEAFKKYFNPDMFNDPLQLGTIFQMVCPDRTKVNTSSSCKTFNIKKALDQGKLDNNNYPFTKHILQQLKEDSLPVGISYCSYMFLGDQNFKGIASKSPLKFQKSQNRDCGKHSSLVMGSRWNKKTNSCELLVRNSWGTGCKKNYPSESMVKSSNGGKAVDQFDVKCEGGNYWVDYKTLENNTFEAQNL